jgi:branched-chain amino acid transport system ATP-binding protein
VRAPSCGGGSPGLRGASLGVSDVVTALLEAADTTGGYGETVVIRNINLRVEPGEVVALLGLNGAGKTTTVLTLSGVLPCMGGQVLYNGKSTKTPLHRRAREGLSLVTEERCLFRHLSVADNLRTCGGDESVALSLFPALGGRLKVKAGLLSGGEQQMLALGRALCRQPSLLIVDELSLGLAAPIASQLLRTVRSAADAGMGVLLVEQHVDEALRISDRSYFMARGQIAFEGDSEEMSEFVKDPANFYA